VSAISRRLEQRRGSKRPKLKHGSHRLLKGLLNDADGERFLDSTDPVVPLIRWHNNSTLPISASFRASTRDAGCKAAVATDPSTYSVVCARSRHQRRRGTEGERCSGRRQVCQSMSHVRGLTTHLLLSRIGTVLHPFCQILAHKGTITIGPNCDIQEDAIIECQ
jgi:hypothetical protein